ncbi:unnamed protein product, partial [Nesidiocoris tenuis]
MVFKKPPFYARRRRRRSDCFRRVVQQPGHVYASLISLTCDGRGAIALMKYC